jgi:hypothetical protein
MNKQPVIIVAVSVGSGAVGFFVGYKIAEKRLSDQFDERLERETKGMREFYTAAKKPYSTPQEAAAELLTDAASTIGEIVQENADKVAYHKIVTQEKYTPEEVREKMDTVVDFGEQPEVVKNIFAKNERDPEIPYVISQEEFMVNERDWEQITLTYYRGDNTLTDHREDIIEEPEKTVGPDGILSFGQGPSDPSTVHICNEKLGLLFEVVLHEGMYTQEVLGIDADPPSLPSGRERNDL